MKKVSTVAVKPSRKTSEQKLTVGLDLPCPIRRVGPVTCTVHDDEQRPEYSSAGFQPSSFSASVAHDHLIRIKPWQSRSNLNVRASGLSANKSAPKRR